jgi:hypothetical protein
LPVPGCCASRGDPARSRGSHRSRARPARHPRRSAGPRTDCMACDVYSDPGQLAEGELLDLSDRSSHRVGVGDQVDLVAECSGSLGGLERSEKRHSCRSRQQRRDEVLPIHVRTVRPTPSASLRIRDLEVTDECIDTVGRTVVARREERGASGCCRGGHVEGVE